MNPNPQSIIEAYDASAPLDRAFTISADWYTSEDLYQLERRRIFHNSWQAVARTDQLTEPGSYVTCELAGEPIVVVRGKDGELRAFFNVCRHHAAEVMTEPCGKASILRCPYHGWSYELDGTLKGVPEWDGVCDFDKSGNSLVPIRVEAWEQFVFVHLGEPKQTVREFFGPMAEHLESLSLCALRFHSRKEFVLNCNWKVFVDNYLDGGYHVPYIHKGLGSVLDYAEYKIENGTNYCLQSSPVDASGGEAETASVRGGDFAYYYWAFPNFMLNWYEGYMDTNVAFPLGTNRCRVVFDFYFGEGATDQDKSVAVAERIQQEDIDICESVQRGLGSRAYGAGRLSVRREAGEHLFHRLLATALRGE